MRARAGISPKAYWLIGLPVTCDSDAKIVGSAVGSPWVRQQESAIAKLAEVEDEYGFFLLAGFEQLAGALVVLGWMLAGERLHFGRRANRSFGTLWRVRRRCDSDDRQSATRERTSSPTPFRRSLARATHDGWPPTPYGWALLLVAAAREPFFQVLGQRPGTLCGTLAGGMRIARRARRFLRRRRLGLVRRVALTRS